MLKTDGFPRGYEGHLESVSDRFVLLIFVFLPIMAEAAGLALGGVALVPLIKQTYDLCHTFRHAPEELREHAQTVQPLAQILDIVKEIVEKATSNPEGYPQWQRFLRAAGETISNTDATVKALQFMCNGNGVSSTPGKFKIRGRFQWTLKNKNKVAEYLERLSACRNDLNVILNANLVYVLFYVAFFFQSLFFVLFYVNISIFTQCTNTKYAQFASMGPYGSCKANTPNSDYFDRRNERRCIQDCGGLGRNPTCYAEEQRRGLKSCGYGIHDARNATANSWHHR